MGRVWRDYSLSLVLAALFLVSWGLQTWTGWVEFAAQQQGHGQEAEAFGPDGYVWAWAQATFENWQSGLPLLCIRLAWSVVHVAVITRARSRLFVSALPAGRPSPSAMPTGTAMMGAASATSVQPVGASRRPSRSTAFHVLNSRRCWPHRAGAVPSAEVRTGASGRAGCSELTTTTPLGAYEDSCALRATWRWGI
jgi:hypothetical protein